MSRMALSEALETRSRPVLVELDPPRRTDAGTFLTGAADLYAAGADAITVADCPIGRASIDSSMLAAKLFREAGIEVLPHMGCRDRNRNATAALLMGLSMEGVRNVLLVTGDPVPQEDRGRVRGVFQFDSCALAREVGELAGQGLIRPFFLCGALNVNAVNFDAELDRASRKEECGIQAFLTQPVTSEAAAENLRRARERLSGYLLGGLFPIVSYRNALFLQREVRGMRIGEEILHAYEGLDREQGEETAVRICLEAASAIARDVDGYYIMTPFQRIGLVKRIMTGLRAMRS